MKCKACQNKDMVYKRMDISFWIGDKLLVVENVWGYECEQCGERVLDAKTTDKVLKTIKSRPADKYIKTPVFSL